MLLGKRSRPAMRRTTSMSGISIDLPESADSSEQSDQITMYTDPDHQPLPFPDFYNSSTPNNNFAYNSFNHGQDAAGNHPFLATMVSPRPIDRRNSLDFLTSCGHCKRRLAAGKDIYMYRGDTAFCSQECREKQMNKDERRD